MNIKNKYVKSKILYNNDLQDEGDNNELYSEIRVRNARDKLEYNSTKRERNNQIVFHEIKL